MKPHKYILIAAFLPSALFGVQTIVTTWRLDVTHRFNYVADSYDTFTPFSGVLTISFPASIFSVTDYGTTTITRFGQLSATSFQSPVTQYIGLDPFGLGVAGASAYTFPNVSDYTSVFLEEFASQGNTYSPDASRQQWWSYHIELRAQTRTSSKGGTGAYDYAFTTESLLDYLYEFASGGRQGNRISLNHAGLPLLG